MKNHGFVCSDCEQAPASLFLPEGRYLCRPCWHALMALRQAVHEDTARRMAARAKARQSR